MIVLLDTHVLLWWLLDSDRVSSAARAMIRNGSNRLLWSAASSWEVAIKYSLGRLPLPEPPAVFLPPHLRRQAIESLPVRDEHGWRVAELPHHHRDPFDRVLIAQAQIEGVPIVSADPRLGSYGVKILW